MRCMDNTKLVDSIEMPLKSCEDVLTAVNKMLSSGLHIYLDQIITPFIGDWPMQFYIRRLVYSEAPSLPTALQNVVALIGPLHISLNTRECVLLIFHEIFADLRTFLFGRKAKLAKKPKAWRISLLLEVFYGGWIIIRDTILSVFDKSKDVQYLTLVNLIDNYVPLVLSIYSIVFKRNNYDQNCQSLLYCWIMCTVFRRRLYNKALLIMLSLFHHWEDNRRQTKNVTKWHLLNLFGEKIVTNRVLPLGFTSIQHAQNPTK